MTSSATFLDRQKLKLAGMVEHQLLRPLAESEQKRWLVVTKDIDEVLSGKGGSGPEFPSYEADAVIGRFCKGWMVSVSRETTAKNVDFKWLKSHDQAWVMMFRGPAEGWRLFGRFARKNLFVGLALWPRGDCVPWAMYQQRATDMIADWEKKWTYEPLRSEKYGDFFSWPWNDRDEA